MGVDSSTVILKRRRGRKSNLITGTFITEYTQSALDVGMGGDDLGSRKVVRQVVDLIQLWFPRFGISKKEVVELVTKAYQAADAVYGAEQANIWAEGFEIPEGTGNRDARELADLGNDLEALVKSRQAKDSGSRFGHERLENWNQNDKDILVLRDLADGMEIVTDPNFKANECPPPFRKKYLEVQTCVNKIMYEQYLAGSVLILPTEVALTIPGIHYSSMHWTTKPNVAKGRPLGDPSNAKSGSALNEGIAGDMVKSRWGEIKHPTLKDLVLMILAQIEKVGDSDEVVLWKMDLANAFGLLNIKPISAKLLAFALTGMLTIIYIVGMFGWQGTPFAFDPISRTLCRQISDGIKGLIRMFVDDLMGVSGKKDVESDLATARKLIITLLGPGSVNDTKTKVGKQMDFIGWSMDLTNRTVYLAEHNFHKTLVGFFTADTDTPISRAGLEKIGSWAARYAEVVVLLRPFVSPFYRMLVGHYGSHAMIPWTPEAVISVGMWRACLCLGALRRDGFVRKFESFKPQPANIRLCYDGSLTGLGIVLESWNGTSWIHICHSSLMVNYANETDSSYQNTMEFTAVVMGFILLVIHGHTQCQIALVGDSTSSLKWGSDGRVKSRFALQAAIMFTLLGTKFGMEVVHTRHVPGGENKECDRLSRGQPSGNAQYDAATITLNQFSSLLVAVELANPFKVLNGMEDFHGFWLHVNVLIESLVAVV